MVTYTIALVDVDRPAAAAGILSVVQEVLEAAGRRHGFGFRWRHWRGGAAADFLARNDAILVRDGSMTALVFDGLDFLEPDAWRPPVIAAEQEDAAGMLLAGGKLLRHLDQPSAAQALDRALDKALSTAPGKALRYDNAIIHEAVAHEAMAPARLGAAVLATL